MANARNERRRANRAVRSIGRMIVNQPTICACYGARDGRPAFAVRPAICGHWFYLVTVDGTEERTAVLRDRPIRDIKRGTNVPVIAEHNLSFKCKRGF